MQHQVDSTEKVINNTFGRKIIIQHTYRTKETLILSQFSDTFFSILIILNNQQVVYSRSFLTLKDAKQYYRFIRKCFTQFRKTGLDAVINSIEERNRDAS